MPQQPPKRRPAPRGHKGPHRQWMEDRYGLDQDPDERPPEQERRVSFASETPMPQNPKKKMGDVNGDPAARYRHLFPSAEKRQPSDATAARLRRLR